VESNTEMSTSPPNSATASLRDIISDKLLANDLVNNEELEEDF